MGVTCFYLLVCIQVGVISVEMYIIYSESAVYGESSTPLCFSPLCSDVTVERQTSDYSVTR